MREILFRGRRIDNGEWVYGYYVTGQYPDKHTRGFIVSGFLDGEMHAVLDDTIGQFTGLCDKNGKKIFEGDIIIVNGFGSTKESNYKKCDIAQVFFDDGMFTHGWCEPYLSDDNIVIGNIHDNPDLLNE